ncbi:MULTISPECIES: hypothetical protein [Actinomycetaceae]|uniref:Uncharacterized protein n=3 Tax=Actinomycetaceae TaxID=2049 RepID=A0AAW9HAU4_9ACTO|nr:MULTISPECIES: hypothetical protein [Actinotignum]WPJ88525.1 hypothetical protein R0V15_06545 [Schaalia turicensis]MDE1558681.1 hypothetical protein [Actinotignum schaalii]MDE1566263.1 hypothetical protein [Actinotignum sanguinis]MDE1578159.1 hypothetical protein [Actinotignum sanguinis]MDE1654255.1 hypothetical protein [Actinotignum schaalii]
MYFLNPTSQLTTQDVRQAVRNLVIDTGLAEIEKHGIPDSAHDVEDTTGKLAHDADAVFDAWVSSIIEATRRHLADEITETLASGNHKRMKQAERYSSEYKECLARAETALECDNQELADEARCDATQAWGKHMYHKAQALLCIEHCCRISDLRHFTPTLDDVEKEDNPIIVVTDTDGDE